MEILSSFTPPSPAPIALSIGNFDGVHLGHRHMLKTLINTSDNLVTSVMTFNPHPKCVLTSCHDHLLTDTHKKLNLISNIGIEQCYLIPFDNRVRTLSPAEFIEKLHAINVKQLVIGKDFRFGYKGSGDIRHLEQNFAIIELQTQVDSHGIRISSSVIRECIRKGEFSRANALLGREFSYTGEVIHGQKLGRTIGFPTANLSINDDQLMPSGVFAVEAFIENKSYRGIANCGRRPTIGEYTDRLLEVFIFEFTDNLYGRQIEVIPRIKLRDEKKFEHISALKEQIKRDIQHAKEALTTFHNIKL